MNNIKQKLVTFELAQLLKINGFDEEVKFRIYPDGMIAASSYLKNYNSEESLVSAPSINDAIDWIEEKYHVFFEIQYHQRNFDLGNKYRFEVIDLTKDSFDGNVLITSKINYKNKNEAYLNAMIQFLEKFGYRYKKEENTKKEEILTMKEEIGIEIEKKTKKFEIISS